MKGQGRITNRAYQEITGVSERTALRDLKGMCDRGLLEKRGKTGRDTDYIITRHEPAKNPS